MEVVNDRKFWEKGDSVKQDDYPGCPAAVVERTERLALNGDWQQVYLLVIYVGNHPEGVDENGERVDFKFSNYNEAHLLRCGN